MLTLHGAKNIVCVFLVVAYISMLHCSLLIESLDHLVRMHSCCARVAVIVGCSELRLLSGFIALVVVVCFLRC